MLFCEMHLDYNSERPWRKGGVFPGFKNRVVMQRSSFLQQGRVRRFGGGRRPGRVEGGPMANHVGGDGHTPVVDMRVNERRNIGGLLPDERPGPCE